MANLIRALGCYRPDAARIAGMGILLLLSIGAGLLKPWPLALLVDHLLAGKPLPSWMESWVGSGDKARAAAWLGGAVLVTHGLQAVLSALAGGVSIHIGLRGLSRIRRDLFAKIQRLSWQFHQQMPAGDLIYRASWDTYAFQTLFQQGLVVGVTSGLTLLLMMGVLLRLDAPLALVALAALPCIGAVIRLIGPGMGIRGGVAQAEDGRVSARVQQTIQALPLIQGYNREPQEQQMFDRQVESARKGRMAQYASELGYGAAVALVFALCTAVIVGWGGQRVLAGQMTLGGLVVFLAYLGQLYEPLNQLSHVGSTLATAGAGTRRIFEILDEAREVSIPAVPRPLNIPYDTVPGAAWLEFRQVGFSYRPGTPVLEEVTLRVERGDRVAIVGSSGAGKSTLLHLLPRFLDPGQGSVLWNGTDLRDLDPRDLRSHIAMVLQEPLLLPGTVAENIALGREGATRREIEAAAVTACADDFIRRLPQGYDTVVGEGAARISVGERQRITIARALLKDAPLVLLDEPTSALDAESERGVLAGLSRLLEGRTALIVTHRPAVLQVASRILVLERGRVVAFGSREEVARTHAGLFSA